MYTDFTALTIDPIIKTKQIVITTNRDIDVNSLTSTVIEVYERSTRTPVLFETEIDDMKLIITLKEWPIPNTDYIIAVKGLKSVIGEELESNIKKRVIFKSHILDKAKIVSPSMHEKIKNSIFELSITSHTEEADCRDCEEEIDPGFSVKEVGCYLEVSTDNAFINTIVKSFTQKSEIEINLPKKGIQYYARVRAQDYEDLKEYGLWSETITFIYGDKDESGEMPDIEEPEIPEFPDSEDDEPIVDLDDFQLLTDLEQGFTPGSMIVLEFNKPLGMVDLSNIIITRKVVR